MAIRPLVVSWRVHERQREGVEAAPDGVEVVSGAQRRPVLDVADMADECQFFVRVEILDVRRESGDLGGPYGTSPIIPKLNPLLSPADWTADAICVLESIPSSLSG
jgi:hypothetical protein